MCAYLAIKNGAAASRSELLSPWQSPKSEEVALCNWGVDMFWIRIMVARSVKWFTVRARG
ncbi:MAG: hypothetical protein IPL78_06685 [Chloroflexi bacterium]|nr:hypothetical protein [Chloroflexota bacterium]